MPYNAACAPLPALAMGIPAMRQLGVSTRVWSINIAAAVLGLLIWLVGRLLPPPTRPSTRALLAAAGIVFILLPFASDGMFGVHRWLSVGGFRLHASAIAAPLLVACVAAASTHRIGSALAVAAAATMILALQPDAAQTTSLAAACAVLLVHSRRARSLQAPLCVALFVAVSAASFLRRDPVPPVAHVEGIFNVIAGGPVSAAMATVALLLLPVPFFAAWLQYRRPIALALGVYVTMTLLAPAWGTFPVPVMGSGGSPIVGYFLALVLYEPRTGSRGCVHAGARGLHGTLSCRASVEASGRAGHVAAARTHPDPSTHARDDSSRRSSATTCRSSRTSARGCSSTGSSRT